MTESNAKPPYNAPRFKVRQYDFDVFAGPRAGEAVDDYEFTDLLGDHVKLSDFKGKWVVVETGSATCSMYTKNIGEMKHLVVDFPDVKFLVVYVREAHPGERFGHHKNIADKIKGAVMLAPRYGETRRILIDSIDGAYHKAHATMPNTCYVIRPDGKVHYRCNWLMLDGLRDALEDRENLHPNEHADLAKLRGDRGYSNMIRTMWTGGLLALWDFIINMPAVLKRHEAIDTYYTEHGEFKKTPEN